MTFDELFILLSDVRTSDNKEIKKILNQEAITHNIEKLKELDIKNLK